MLFISCKKKEVDSVQKYQSEFATEEFLNLSYSDKRQYLDSIYKILNETEAESVLNENYLKLANQYYQIKSFAKSREVYRKILKLKTDSTNAPTKAKAFSNIADTYELSQKDSAYYYYYQAEKLYQKLLDQNSIALMQYNKAYILFSDGNYSACEVELSKALKNLSTSSDFFLLYSCNSLMGNCLEKSGDFEEALSYHQNASSIISDLNIDPKEAMSYKVATAINISNLYDIKGEYDKSIANLEKILTEELEVYNPLSYARVLSNLAYSKFKNKQYDEVESMFLRSVEITKNNGQNADLLYKYLYLGEFYANQKDTSNAIKYLSDAKVIAQEASNSNELMTILKLLSKIDKVNSEAYSLEYILISDNQQELQTRTRDKYARIEYETDKIEDANKTLSRNNVLIIGISVVSIVFLLIFIIGRYVKFKNKELRFLRMQEKASEEIFSLLAEQQKKINQAKETEKTKIAQELHDGIVSALYGIRINLEYLNPNCQQDAIDKRMNYLEELKKVESDIRSISHDLSRNAFFDNSDYNKLLSDLVEKQEGISATRFTYINADNFNWNTVPNLCKINLYRVIQEAIVNVNKHASAQNCLITVQNIENQIRILIQDDGIGFNSKSKKNGIGYRNMISRIKHLEGTIDITSEIGKGTTIEILVDIAIKRKSNSKPQ